MAPINPNIITTLPIRRANAAALAPYGKIIGTDPSVPVLPISFYGGAVEVRKPSAFESAAAPDLTVCRLQARPLEIDYLERHPLHTQAFIPLGGKPFVAVFGPAQDEMPTPDALEAFVFDGTSGFMMHKDVWHEFPFALEDGTDMIVLLSSETNANLQDAPGDDSGDAHGPDLDKRNYRSRVGTVRLMLPDEGK